MDAPSCYTLYYIVTIIPINTGVEKQYNNVEMFTIFYQSTDSHLLITPSFAFTVGLHVNRHF